MRKNAGLSSGVLQGHFINILWGNSATFCLKLSKRANSSKNGHRMLLQRAFFRQGLGGGAMWSRFELSGLQTLCSLVDRLLGGVTRGQKMLKGHVPSVIYHQV